ncbi:MAG: hypothetical protein K6A23_09320, partial [Butyrivibrio sp.]|nr:hypothetical protein [Butyrivibrio sp.]
MKLRKTLLGFCIWGIYTVFTIFLIAYSAYSSKLLSDDQTILYTTVFTVLSVLVVAVVTFLSGKVKDTYFYKDYTNDRLSKLLFGVASLLLMAASVIYRLYIVFNSSLSLSGNTFLYEAAMVGSDSKMPKSDLLSYVYSNVLKFILGFTGNAEIVAPVYQVFIQMLMIVLVFFALRITMGRIAAFVGTAYISFMPVFVTGFFNIYALNLFYLFFAAELFVVALFAKGEADRVYNNPVFYVWFVFVGVTLGFMLFIDAGTAVAFVFLLATLFLADVDLKNVLLHLLTVVLSAGAMFAIMLVQQAGFSGFADSYNMWHDQYFKSLSMLALFTFYNDYAYLYLATMIAMGIAIIGFFRGGKKERISPWLLITVLVAIIIPFLGSTRMNSQFMVTLFYGIAIAAGFS